MVPINPFVRFSVARYVLSIGLFGAVVAFGLLATRSLGVDLLPSVNIPVVSVTVQYPGASPLTVDQQVTQVLENAVSRLGGISQISATSSQGLSRVVVSFGPDTDRVSALNQVAAQVAAAARSLPSGTTPPAVQSFDPNAQPVLEFGLYAPGKSLEEVYAYAQDVLLPLLQQVSGVANVSLQGGPERGVWVYLDPARLASYRLTPSQVAQALQASTVENPIGSLTRSGTTLSLATRSLPQSAEEVGDLLVDPSRGIRVRDLGRVEVRAEAGEYARVNGHPVVLVSVQQASGSNAVAVVDGVKRALAQTRLPEGYQVLYSNDTTLPIRASLERTYRELFLTAAVVAVVVLLFLGRLNTAFTVILAIPISLSAAPILYQLLGFSFNLVSLLALIVAIGIVVDDSIVVAENVERYRAQGLDQMRAVLVGASEVFSAVAAATLSLLAVLLPVSFIGGFAGRYVEQFALGLAAAVAMSWLEALLFLTVRMAYTPDAEPLTWQGAWKRLRALPEDLAYGLRAFRRGGWLLLLLGLALFLWRWKPALLPLLLLYPLALGLGRYLLGSLLALLEALTLTLHGYTERALERVRQAYARSLPGLLDRAPWVLGGSLLFFLLVAGFFLPRIPFTFTPQSDAGYVRARLSLPPGTSLSRTNALAGRVEGYFLLRPEVATVQTEVSGNGASFVIGLRPHGERPSLFQLLPLYQQGVRALLQDEPSARFLVFGAGGGGGGGFQGTSLTLNLASASQTLLKERLEKAVALLSQEPDLLGATPASTPTSLQFTFRPDPNRLQGTGLTPAQVAQFLQGAVQGVRGGQVELQGFTYPITVRLDPERLSDLEALLSLPVPTASGTLPVRALGALVPEEAPTSLQRQNRLYVAQITVSPSPTAPPPALLLERLSRRLTEAGILDSQVVLTEGQAFGPARMARELQGQGVFLFFLAFFMAYLVMGAQFNSFRYPLYLLLPVPLAIAGALLFLYLTGNSLDIFGILGFLLLIGLSAKNAILYLDFVSQRLGRMPLKEALVEAAYLRFRPIVMTTLTIFVISLPLLLGRGAGAEFGQGLGVVMFGGILVSALLTFFVVPAAFYLFERHRAPTGGEAPA
ncbi:multidrug transporter [Thermus composti]|uniref:Efflux RND transporter permease subunit n=1 Tax=Thermus composti TaxID=532059 RepID=A0ABV6PYQ9_9DEIN|nr:efflux RND transporter permease subunit [Thermus composti]GGM93173.1 multidrug transporter [Thermus composti]